MQAEGSNKDKKVLQVSTSALVGLKAALYSKQQAAKRDKTNTAINESSHTRRVSDKTAAIWKKPNKKVKSQNNNKNVRTERVLSQQEEDDLEKSRRALEAKAALYERLSKGRGLKEVEGEEGEESKYMVDFTKKIYKQLQDENAESAPPESQSLALSVQRSSARESPPQVQSIPAGNSPPAEEWVEYEDEFGRTRKCLKSELPEKLSKRSRNERSVSPQLLSEDMRRERERVRWEREAEEELGLEEPVGPVHYQTVQAGEVRNHGVGYYQFSQSEEERQQQMEALDKLRTETATERDKKDRLKEKRKALLEARLAKIKEKRNQQRRAQGLADIEFEIGESESKKEEEPDSNDIRALLDAEMERSKVNSFRELEKAEEEERGKHIRPWDKGKVVDLVRKRKQELEDERLSEFAPPPSYLKEESSKKMKNDIGIELPIRTSASSAGTAVPPPSVPSCHSNTVNIPPSQSLPPYSHGNPMPPWLSHAPPHFMVPPPPSFPWYPPPPPWGQYYPPPLPPDQNQQPQ